MNTFVLFSFLSLIIFSFTSELTSAADSGVRPPTRTDEEIAALYEEWLIKHGKINNNNHNLLGEKPSSKRFEIFKDNLNYIDHHNSIPNQTYKLGLTRFADLTNQEFQSMYLDTGIGDKFRKLSSSESYSDRYLPKPGDNLPDSVDWREKGAVTSVKDQGGCGACWAFTAVSTIEAINKIVTGDLISLSAQELIDCDTKSTNEGCKGGLMNPAYDFIIENGGIDSEEDYPYKGRDGICDPYREKANVVTIDGYENVPENNEEALKKAVANQVVGVALSFGNTIGFQLYQSGIYTGLCGDGTKFDHGVSIVGYGSEDGLDYWILKNSWSTSWGDNGYMKLQRNVADSQGLCALAAHPSYPLKTGPNPPNPGPSPPAINPPTVCDHFNECPAGSTCCCISSGYFLGDCLIWGCCPSENAVCCEEDPSSCCPHNYPICNTLSGTCSMRKNNPFGIRMMKHTLATPIMKTFSSRNEAKKSSV